MTVLVTMDRPVSRADVEAVAAERGMPMGEPPDFAVVEAFDLVRGR